MKICQQVLLVTWESCANVMFECKLFVLQCALPQSIQLVGKTTLTICTQENLVVIILTAMIGNFMLSSGSMGFT